MVNVVVDAASIEVNRRARRAKSDGLDASKLLQQLQRYHGGERKVWSVVNVPGVADEDRRQLHRDVLEMKFERTRHSNRIKGLLAACGLEGGGALDRAGAGIRRAGSWGEGDHH